MNSANELPVQCEGFALSPQQSVAWLRLHEQGTGPGCHAVAATIYGADAAQVETRLAALVAQQEIFRTTFERQEQLREPVQVPHPWTRALLSLRMEDWRDRDGAQLQRAKDEVWRQALDWQVGSGIRGCCAMLPGGVLYLVLAVAPLAADAATLLKLVRVADGSLEPDADNCPQYADLAAWLQDVTLAAESAAGRRFWERLGTATSRSRIALDDGQPLAPAARPQYISRELPEALCRSLTALAHGWGIGVDDLYFGSWLWLLRAMSTGGDLPPVARVLDGITADELAAAYGPLERQLPFSLDRDGSMGSAAELRAVAAMCGELREYQDCFHAGERTVTPYAFQWLDVAAMESVVERLFSQGEQFRAKGGVIHRQGSNQLFLESHEQHFGESAPAQLLEQWEYLLADIAADDGAATYGLCMSAAYGAHLLALGQGPTKPMTAEETVLGWLEQRLATGAGCIIDGATFDLRTVNARANRLARLLRTDGIGKGLLVGLHLPRSVDYVVAMLAVLKSGAAYMPMDADYPAARLQYMAEQARPALIISFDFGSEGLVAVQGTRVTTFGHAEADAHAMPETNLAVALHGDDLAYVLYTSGSSGKPKGVAMPHRALFNHMRWMLGQFDFGPDDVFLQRTSSSFDASVWEFWAPMLAGASMVIARQDKVYDLAHLMGLIAKHKVTVAQFVPSLLATLIEYPTFTATAMLRRVFVGGEALTPGLRDKFFARMKASLCNLYGPTETCIESTFHECAPDDAATLCIGRPIDNTSVAVVDREGRLAGVGIAGEIWIGGAGLFDGYLNDEQQTAARIAWPKFAAARYYRTGDMGRMLADGTIEYLGRIDQQIKLNGYRIELSEIDVVLEAQAGILRAATTLLENGQLAAFVQATDGDKAQAALAKAGDELPAYMLPTQIVTVAAMPTLPNGKIDRAALATLSTTAPATPFCAPASALERELARIWGHVLRREQVSVTDRFFAIGGDSIRSIQVVYEAGLRGMPFTVMDVFQFQTIRALAAHLETRPSDSGRAQPSRPVNTAPADLLERYVDAYPATEMQRYMIERYAADSAATGVFHAQQAFLLSAPDLDVAALAQALTLAADAPNFRTRFVAVGSDWFQVLVDGAGPTVDVVDLQDLVPQAQDAVVMQRIEADRLDKFDPFDINRPLLRICMCVLARDRVDILLSNHHAVQDGWGNVEFTNRVNRHYAALRSGTAAVERVEDEVCKEFALLQRATVDDPAQVAFWQQQVAAMPKSVPVLERCRGQAYLFKTVELDERLVRAVHQAGRQHNLTPKVIFLSAYAAALRQSGLPALIGVVSNGRDEQLSDPFHAMGLFWNLMPVHVDGSATGIDRCIQLQHQLLELEPYSRFPLRRIEILAGRHRLVWTSFNFVNFHNQQMGGGAGNLIPIRMLDNFGLPVSLAVGVDGEHAMTALLQLDADLAAMSDVLAGALISELGNILGQPGQSNR